MEKHTGLICAYLLDGKGGGKPLSWEEVQQWQPQQGLLWVHLNYTHKQAKQWLQSQASLSPIVIKIMTAAESRPRTTFLGESVLTILRGINHNPGEKPDDMVSIRIFAQPNLIITARKRKLLSIDDMRLAIEQNRGPETSGKFIAMLTDYLATRMSDALESVDEKLDQFDIMFTDQKTYQLRGILAEIRRKIVGYRRYLSPQREALNRLVIEKIEWINDYDRLSIREVVDRVTRYVEDMDSARDRAGVAYEELLGSLSERMEKRMYVLSIVAAIFLPLTFVTGLLGINVAGIPYAENPWAFHIVVAMTLVIVILQIIWFKRKHWF